VLTKVFLVEDEIVTREGIRDNVDWESIGYQFCGEASDGEMALPLIRQAQPDVLITDIRMPFMDGLELCRIVREHMPGLKIIILSGHDEFEYAQQAVELGVTQYLLKPVGVRMLQESLTQVASEIGRERAQAANLQEMRQQLEENRAVLRERFLMQLLSGGLSTPDAITKSRELGIELVARFYLVLALRVEGARTGLGFENCQRAKEIVCSLMEHHDDVLLIQKDFCELLLIVMGDSIAYLEHAGYLLTQLIRSEITEKLSVKVASGVGEPQSRISDIPVSLSQALLELENASGDDRGGASTKTDKAELLKLDRTAVAEYLRFGVAADYDSFNARAIRPLAEAALRSQVIKTVAMVDVALTTARFVAELGGSVDTIVPEINNIETLLRDIRTSQEFERQVREIIMKALEFRDSAASAPYADMIHRARQYVLERFSDPDLSLSETAAQVNLSPSHFSAVFSRESGETFKEYVTSVKIHEAKALLRSTSLTSTEIGYRVGYRDPHYFSHVFRRQTGLTPGEYRRQITSD
jgi:two-component system response regulator YesN